MSDPWSKIELYGIKDDEETKALRGYASNFWSQLGVAFCGSGAIALAVQMITRPDLWLEGGIVMSICVVFAIGCYYIGEYKLKGRN